MKSVAFCNKPVNLPIEFRKKLNNININIIYNICAWCLTFGMFVGLAILMIRCF